MMATTIGAYLEELENSAQSASTVEENVRREFIGRLADLERERQFAYRRFNLMAAVFGAMTDAKDADEADAKVSPVVSSMTCA